MVLSLQDTSDQLEEQKRNRGKLPLWESKNFQTDKSVDMVKLQICLHSYKWGRTGQECESWCHPRLPVLMGCWISEKWRQGAKISIITGFQANRLSKDLLGRIPQKTHQQRIIEWKGPLKPSSSNSPAIGRDTSNDKESTTSLGYLILRTSPNQVQDLVLFGLIEWSSHGPTPQACHVPLNDIFSPKQINRTTQLEIVCTFAEVPLSHNMSLIKILDNTSATTDT